MLSHGIPICSHDSRGFFFTSASTTEIYPLSLHDALPISPPSARTRPAPPRPRRGDGFPSGCLSPRSEEHTSELQSHSDLVCRLLLEKKKPPIAHSIHLGAAADIRCRHRVAAILPRSLRAK